MNKLIAWFAQNQVAANLMMVLIVVAGLLSLQGTRKELIPNISLGKVSINIMYPGASPKEVEQSVCVRVEENIFDIEGIRQITSNVSEGSCTVVADIQVHYDTRDVMAEIKSRIDSIVTFPVDAERPVIREISIKTTVANVVVSGDTDEHTLKGIAEAVRDELTELKSITQVALTNSRDYELSIELSETSLHEYDLSFDEVSQAVKTQSLNLPGGNLKTAGGDRLLRTEAQAYSAEDFEKINLRSNRDGSYVKLSDVANVVDGFEDIQFEGRFNGKPGLLITVYRVGEQNILEISDSVKAYVKSKSAELPQGISIDIWQDKSDYFKSRMYLLIRNALTGLFLVFLILVLFLRLRLAFWVSMGIPVSFMGAFWLLPNFDGSINMISMFGFILVLGIVVDDAIVVGENVHKYHLKGKLGLEGAIAGAQDVSKPVIFAVLTSVVAFMPILFLPGPEGRLWMVIPLVVILTLLFSLVECLFILPAHLATIKVHTQGKGRLSAFQKRFSDNLENFIERVYRPFLSGVLHWRYATLSVFIAVFTVFVSVLSAGWLHTAFFPKVEGDIAIASFSYAQGTPVEKTQQAIEKIEQAAHQLRQQIVLSTGTNYIENVVSSVGMQPMSSGGKTGGHAGEVSLSLLASEERKIESAEIIRRWREQVGEIAGATQLSFQASLRNQGPDISIELTGSDTERLIAGAKALKKHLQSYAGVYDIQDSYEAGKKEIRLHLRPQAEHLGINVDTLARQVRQAFYGEQVQRIQRGHNEVRVFVRYPRAQRRSLYFLETMYIHLPDGVDIPLSEVADIEYASSPSQILRIDRKRVIKVSARVDESKSVVSQVQQSLEKDFLQTIERQFAGVKWDKSGRQRSQAELVDTMIQGFILALLGIYILMAIPFKSYTQPLMVMSAIPFGLIGAILGHMLLGLDVSLLSLSGMIAVAGVVVNDNLVLVDYINRRREEGVELSKAIRDAGAARFRPIVLTSLTTFAGLTPLMLERSVQAQFLIPMAVSLAFGVMFATIVSLLLVPASYYILEDVKAYFSPEKST
ncbi:Acriflavin resistance protein [hydrothermal vent metagenome]|uniref:Acriflavin resistance protein n=1 Tax=hydrothermal vent metagenome TaxID=652676 RepID=A0A3B0XYB9_9ZZZZ